MGSLAAYALEEKRKSEQEQAKQAQREAHEDEHREKTQAKQMAKLEAKWAQEHAWEDERKEDEQREALYQAHRESRLEEREIKEEAKRVAEEKVEKERKQAEKERKKAEELKAIEAAQAVPRNKGEEEAVVTQKKKSVWERGLDWIDQHQAEVALGLGVAVGIGAIIISGGIAAPLVAAAWVAGAAVVAVGTVAAGTVGLNLHYGREWKTNLLRNVALAGVLCCCCIRWLVPFTWCDDRCRGLLCQPPIPMCLWRTHTQRHR